MIYRLTLLSKYSLHLNLHAEQLSLPQLRLILLSSIGFPVRIIFIWPISVQFIRPTDLITFLLRGEFIFLSLTFFIPFPTFAQYSIVGLSSFLTLDVTFTFNSWKVWNTILSLLAFVFGFLFLYSFEPNFLSFSWDIYIFFSYSFAALIWIFLNCYLAFLLPYAELSLYLFLWITLSQFLQYCSLRFNSLCSVLLNDWKTLQSEFPFTILLSLYYFWPAYHAGTFFYFSEFSE